MCPKNPALLKLKVLLRNSNIIKFKIITDKLKHYKSPSIDLIPDELIQAGSRALYEEIHKLIVSISNKEKWLQQWKEFISFLIYKYQVKPTAVTAKESASYKILSNILLVYLTSFMEEISGDYQWDSTVIGKLLIRS